MMERLFPEELLNSTPAEKSNYFKMLTVSHPAFEEAYNDLLDRIYRGTENSIILVYGPTGAGKSTLIKKVKEKIIKDNLSVLDKDKGLIPYLAVESVPPDSGSFDWKDFYYRALIEANEQLIDYKILLENKNMDKKVKDENRSALRRSLENVLIYRKPKAFIIDEAQHITMTISGRNLRNQVNILKSLGNITKVPIILTGTYDLLAYRDLNGQTIRRGTDIELRRYQANNQSDIESFINVLLAFQKHLPLELEPNLIDYWDYFYSRTIGCVGILKDWLYLTLQSSLRANPLTKTLELTDFKRYELSSERCMKLLTEASYGESKLKVSDAADLELYQKLGLVQIEQENEVTVDENVKKRNKSNKKGRPVGQRKPKRDQVGNTMADAQ
ncbi:ATP-binding protein [Bacillus luteolus]|uniref:ATP-binding protein n=1 Tax=Litchfieldia luteola TaxID=682179 RepID=A0ABR9QEQ3_9BACI|nr:ATP-binding protein [Cytobacillus luteolus]MBE4906943.1 ATP-binding protein [Cytobacillus luteolus]MBP1943592.1 energy-coupling factor transporter ATP-binding protein EcfA2 [Cytobacillus luteolus]